MTLRELCKLSHEMAVEKGFWEEREVDCGNGYNTSIEPNISEKLMLCVTELAEACEALRKNNRQTKKHGGLLWYKDTFEDEIADTFIRLGDLCEYLGIDIEWQIQKKMEYNKTRPKLHGKEF